MADDVGDVAGVDVGVALARGELAGGCAVAAVTEPQLAGRLVGDAEGGEGGVDGAQRGGVAVGVVGGVDGGVAKAGVLGDRVAASGGGVEHRGQGGEVEADATLHVDEEGPAGDDGALDAGVRQAAHPRAGAGLGAADEARRLAAAHGGVGGVGGVEGVEHGLGPKPRVAVGDSRERPLSAAVGRCALGATEQVGRVG